MRYVVLGVTAILAMATTALQADALKKSLSGMLHKKDDTPAMVNLDMAKAKPISRSPKTVVAVAMGTKLRKKTLDEFLKERTKGNVSDFDKLDKSQKIALVKEYMLPSYIVQKAKKDIPFDERKLLYTQAWLQEAARKTEVPEEKIRAAYDALVDRTKAQSALGQVPPYEQIKERLKLQIAQRQIVAQLMRGATVKEVKNEKDIVGYAGSEPIFLKEAQKATEKLTRGKKSWETLSQNERMQLLHMLAPQVVLTKMAMQNLTLEQKKNLISNVWMQKEIARTHVDEKAIKKRYKKIKTLAKKQKKKKKLPTYDEVKPMLKAQLAQEKIMKRLMKEIKVKLK
jgi:hypothetical protein